MPSIPEILRTEFSNDFVEGMRKRMAISFHKYGPIANAYPSKVHAILSLKQRIEMYEQTHNTEYLMDIANFAMIEFMYPRYNDAHFTPTDDSGSPGRTSARTGKVDERDNEHIGGRR